MKRPKPVQWRPRRRGGAGLGWELKRTALGMRSLDELVDDDVREAEAYMSWVRTRPCRVAVSYAGGITQCLGQIHAHHAGERGLGQRASDWTCVALCARHHGEIHDCRGTFTGWSKQQRREWQDAQIAATRAEWMRLRNQDPDAGLPF